jgi:ATP-dependent Clp protease ATP-binding subunit ClpA
MRLLRRPPRPKAKTFRPAEPYLITAASDARRLGHQYIGTEHLLLGLVRDRDSRANWILKRLGASRETVENALQCWLTARDPKIDPQALATLGIDYDAVLERLEETFGAGALEHTHQGCLGVCPRVKKALAFAADYADDQPVRDEHVLLGMLTVPDSVACRILNDLGVTFEAVEALAKGSLRG